MGGDLGGLGGGPPKFDLGDGPCIRDKENQENDRKTLKNMVNH